MGVGVGGRILCGLGVRGVSLQLQEVSVGVGVGVLLQPRDGVGVVVGAPLHVLLGVLVGGLVGAAACYKS